MKRILLGLAIIGLLLPGISVKAQSDGQLASTKNTNDEMASKISLMKGREIAKVYYIKPLQDNVEISVFNEKGKLLAKQRINSNEGFIKPFNFSQLESGNYTFEISDSEGTRVENYTINRSERKISSVYKIKDTKKFNLSIIANQELVNIQILDSEGNVLLKEKLESMSSFSRIYDLSDFNGNGVYFQIKTENDEDFHYYGF